MTLNFNSIKINYGKTDEITKVIKATMSHPMAAVEYNGRTWTIKDSQGLDFASQIKPQRWDRFVHHLRLIISKVFKTNYKANFEKTVKKLENAQIKYNDTIAKTTQHSPASSAPTETEAPVKSILVEKGSSEPVAIEKFNEIQRHLDAKRIPIKCKDIAQPLANPNRILKEEIVAYLANLAEQQKDQGGINSEAHQLKKKLFDSIDMITYDEFRQELTACCEILNRELGSHDYAIGIIPGKNSQWVAELAMPLMHKLPESHFQPDSDLATGIRHVVIFVDVNFDSWDFDRLTQKIKKQTNSSSCKDDYHIYCVTPFMSSMGQRELDYIFHPVHHQHLKPHVITSKRPIKNMVEAGLSRGEIDSLIKIDQKVRGEE